MSNNKTLKRPPIYKDSNKLSAYMEHMRRPDKTRLINRISQECMVTRGSVFHWIYGIARIPAYHRAKIEEVLGVKLFENYQTP